MHFQDDGSRTSSLCGAERELLRVCFVADRVGCVDVERGLSTVCFVADRGKVRGVERGLSTSYLLPTEVRCVE